MIHIIHLMDLDTRYERALVMILCLGSLILLCKLFSEFF